MTEQSTLLSRIGRWFRKDQVGANGDVVGEPQSSTAIEHRTTFLRPWAKRDAAIQNLQEGFHTLTDLMGAIRDNLDKQNARQAELMSALSQLPAVMQTLPENNRVQAETLHAIRQQIEGQSAQQERLGEILNKIGTNTGEQRQMVDSLRERVEDLHKSDTTIADYLNNVGVSLKDVSKNSQTSAQVLENMRDNIAARDGQIERVMHRQGVRLTTMLAAAIFLSVAALVAVCVMGYLLMTNKPG
jgi:chromosome segregation ATPase